MSQHKHSLDVNGKIIEAVVDVPAAEAGSVGSGQRPALGMVLAHGASGDMDSGYFPALAAALASKGIPVVRFTHKSPSVTARAAVYEAVLRAASGSWPETSHIHHWVCAGHSMGSRAACEVVAKLPGDAGTVGSLQVDDTREDWLRMVCVPGLMVRGTKDPFSSQEVFEDVMGRVGKEYLQVYELAGGGHDLVGKKGPDTPVFQGLLQSIVDFLQKVSQGARAKGSNGAAPKTSKAAKAVDAKPGAKGGSKKDCEPAASAEPKVRGATRPAAVKPKAKRPGKGPKPKAEGKAPEPKTSPVRKTAAKRRGRTLEVEPAAAPAAKKPRGRASRGAAA